MLLALVIFVITMALSIPVHSVITGTCCMEKYSICVIGERVFVDYYYQASGPCGPPLP